MSLAMVTFEAAAPVQVLLVNSFAELSRAAVRVQTPVEFGISREGLTSEESLVSV